MALGMLTESQYFYHLFSMLDKITMFNCPYIFADRYMMSSIAINESDYVIQAIATKCHIYCISLCLYSV